MDSVTEEFCSTFHVGSLLECITCNQVARHEGDFSRKGTKKRRRHKEKTIMCNSDRSTWPHTGDCRGGPPWPPVRRIDPVASDGRPRRAAPTIAIRSAVS